MYSLLVVFGTDSGALSTFAPISETFPVACTDLMDLLQVRAGGEAHNLNVLRHRNGSCGAEEIFACGVF